LLCALAADLDITDFSINTDGFSVLESTANYIGRMFGDGTIKNRDLIFVRQKGHFPVESQFLDVDSPLFIGFRQLPLERWPTTPLFFLDIADGKGSGTQHARALPWRVTFRRNEADDSISANGADAAESFKIDRIVDQNGDEVGTSRLLLRLQTLRNTDGYWLDTGIINPS